MSSKDSALYNQRPHNLKGGKEISSSNSLAFTSQLNSLITSSTARPSKPKSVRIGPKKEDILKRPNRNSAKRAKLDHESSAAFEQKHSTNGVALDQNLWKRSQAKMQEKARLYAAMKRGDVEDVDERYAVDFDRKWAETYDEEKETISDDDHDDDSTDEEDKQRVSYTDEFGRTRTGTRLEAARIARIANARSDLESDRFTARPSAPTTVIRGDTIQHAAFQPDAVVADQMEELARKRDASLTPPPEEYFDGRKEVRNKGTGFFQFSGDAEERRKQMQGLAEERERTERVRGVKRK